MSLIFFLKPPYSSQAEVLETHIGGWPFPVLTGGEEQQRLRPQARIGKRKQREVKREAFERLDPLLERKVKLEEELEELKQVDNLYLLFELQSKTLSFIKQLENEKEILKFEALKAEGIKAERKRAFEEAVIELELSLLAKHITSVNKLFADIQSKLVQNQDEILLTMLLH